MRPPIQISHRKYCYRVIFRSTRPEAIIPLDDDREQKMRSRAHVLNLGLRDYDVSSETAEDAVQSARNLLALDRQVDRTEATSWRIHKIAQYERSGPLARIEGS